MADILAADSSRSDSNAIKCLQVGTVQLIVWSIEEKVVGKLRQRDALHGVSIEEEHRRTLPEAPPRRGRGGRRSFADHLAKMPDVGDDNLFERTRAQVRRVRF